MKNNNKNNGLKNTNPLNETTQKNKKQNGLLILLAVIALIAAGAAAVLFWTDKNNRDTKICKSKYIHINYYIIF